MKLSAIWHRVKCAKCSAPIRAKTGKQQSVNDTLRCPMCGHRFTATDSAEKALQQGAYDSMIENAIKHKLEVNLKGWQ